MNGSEQFSTAVTVPAGALRRLEHTFPGPGAFFGTRYAPTASVDGEHTVTETTTVTGSDGFESFTVLIEGSGWPELDFLDAV